MRRKKSHRTVDAQPSVVRRYSVHIPNGRGAPEWSSLIYTAPSSFPAYVLESYNEYLRREGRRKVDRIPRGTVYTSESTTTRIRYG